MEKKWMDKNGKKLIKDITKKFIDPQRKQNKFFDYNLIIVLALHLETRNIGIENTRIESIAESRLADVRTAHDIFFNTILPEISVFKRTDAEADAFVMVLFEEILKTISRPIYAHMEKKGLLSLDIDMRGGIS